MLRTGQLLAPLTETLLLRFDRRDLSRRREPCYRGPWCLPGPDSHRLADDSLSHAMPSGSSFLSSGIRAAGCTITSVSFTRGSTSGLRSWRAQRSRFFGINSWVLDKNVRARRFYEAGGWSAGEAVKSDERAGFQLDEVRYRYGLV
jgi:hypothetical protein